MSDTPRVPDRLGEQGRSLWDSIIPAYELQPDELRVLVDACREADLIERLQLDLEVSELMVRGSQGQLVASPLVSELRQHRAVLSQLLSKLKIPASPATAARKRAVVSEQAVSAARKRWGSGAGAS